MDFVYTCVGLVITVGIAIVTLLFGLFLEWVNNDDGFGIYLAWLLTSIGFGICLTILLFQNGIIKI